MQDPTSSLFQLALGLTPPWEVKRIEFDPEGQRLDIHLDFANGARFVCPECGAGKCPVHDTTEKEWRHLSFFQHEAYLHARVPRVRCDQDGVRLVDVPWARAGSGFTVLFEALAMMLMREMPVKAAGKIVGESDTRLWRVMHHHVNKARASVDLSGVGKVGVDETSHRRGQSYVSSFVDLAGPRVIYVTPGRDQTTVERFKADLIEHQGQAGQISEFSLDMSAAFVAGIRDSFPAAEITFDKFHVVQQLNKAVDAVRREEQKTTPALQKTRYLWLHKSSELSQEQRTAARRLGRQCRQTGRAYELKLEFEDFWKQTPEMAAEFLDDWCQRVSRTRLPALQPLRDFVNTVDNHWDGILRWFQSRITNGVLEGINSLIQAAKRRARGYRTDHNYIAMIYMIAGKLDFKLPSPIPARTFAHSK